MKYKPDISHAICRLSTALGFVNCCVTLKNESDLELYFDKRFFELLLLEDLMLAVLCTNKAKGFFFNCCTVHSDICRVHSPTNALLLILKNALKFTLKYT
jgi:hypothetical protein